MNRYLPLFVSLSFLIAASGCTVPEVQTGNGVVIQEFFPGFSEVFPGEPVTFYLKFKNIGSAEAKGVFAELIGLDADWASSSSGLGDIYHGEMLPQERSCQYTGSGHVLMPPNPLYGTEGEVGTCTWKYRVPDVPSGLKPPTYEITGRVFYNYRTDLVKSFTVFSADELLRLKQAGQSIPSSTVSLSRAPVTISVKSMEPIRFWEEQNQVSFPIAVTVSNSGGGMACLEGKCKKEGQGGNEWNKLMLSINPMGKGIAVDSACSEFSGGTGGEIEVWPKRDNTIVCDIRVDIPAGDVARQDKTVRITAQYSYFTDAKTSITML